MIRELTLVRTNKRILITIIISLLLCWIGIYALYNNLYESIAVKGKFYNICYKELQKKDSINTVCIFVPHPDDEIWLAGSIIKSFREVDIDVHVIYYTNGRSSMQGERNIEALKSCLDLGVVEKNVHFLGFENFQQFEESFPDGTRTPQIRADIKKAIKRTIMDLRPQLIIANDFDFNRDHRLFSILFDESVGEMLNTNLLNPTTKIWKGFCYNTSYYSKNDYYDSINLISTKKPIDVQNKTFETDIPQFVWRNRLRLPVYKDVLERSEGRNYIMDAIRNHVTQHIYLKYLCSINSDAVFWSRTVDNRFRNAEITVSSGNSKYLTDFKFYDCNDIRYSKRYNVDFRNYLWQPAHNDMEKSINATFWRPEHLKKIVLYDDPSIENNIKSVRITLNDTCIIKKSIIDEKGGPTEVDLPNFPICFMKISIDKYEGKNPGIAEIEAISKTNTEFEVNKICDEHDNFVYKAFIPSKAKTYRLGYYSSANRKCNISILYGDHVTLKNNELLVGKKFKHCTLILKDHVSGTIYDAIEVVRLNQQQEFFWNVFRQYDYLKLRISDRVERNTLVQKIIRIIHYPQGLWN